MDTARNITRHQTAALGRGSGPLGILLGIDVMVRLVRMVTRRSRRRPRMKANDVKKVVLYRSCGFSGGDNDDG